MDIDYDSQPSPDHAPLPVPFWLWVCQVRLVVLAPQQKITPRTLKTLQQSLEKEKINLLRGLDAAREQAFTLLNPLVENGDLTRPNLVRLFQEHANGPSRQTFTLWKQRGLLRYRGSNPDPQSAATLLVARLLLPEMKSAWLPSTMAPHEPIWWCWRQDSPDAPVVPCPFPIPADVPSSARLWTPWQGAVWEKDSRIAVFQRHGSKMAHSA